MADVFDYMKKIQDEIVKSFDVAFSGKYKKPLTEITQNKKQFIMNVRLPGISKKNIFLEVRKDRVEIKAGQKKKKVKKSKKKYSKEESYKGFYRVISLPPNLDTDKALAIYKKNSLTVKIPKLKVKKVRIR